ncbi:MAG: hypothetical protein FWG15_03805 [Propionibacteriaceae bacterium]|jgi:hypothetical protein|nr:hypothetical protein [Propionibacteriaceae bacterium]
MTKELPTIVYDGTIDLDTESIHDPITGEQITNDVMDKENDDIDRRHGLIPGGKSLSGDGSHSPVLRVVVSKETRDHVQQAAREAGVSVSRWLRHTVEEKLAA